MPSFKTAGKSKQDLAVVAQLSGLLSTEQTDNMTRAQLVTLLKEADAKKQAESAGDAAASDQKAASETKKPATRKKPAGSKSATASGRATKSKTRKKSETKSTPDTAVKKGTTTRRKSTKKPADAAKTQDDTDTKPSETIDTEKEGAAKKESRTPAKKHNATQRKRSSNSRAPATAAAKAATNEDLAAQAKASSDPKAGPQGDDTDAKPQSVIKFEPKEDPAQVRGEDKKSEPETSPAAQPVPAETKERQPQAKSKKTAAENDNKSRRNQVEAGEMQSGVLEIMPDGYGFMRKDNYLQGSKDIYVPPQYIRRFSLRPGDFIVGPVKTQRESDRYQALLYIKEVNGRAPEKMLRRPRFDRLTPIYPDERFNLESSRNELSTRIIDLVAPIGKGQRGMIVSPPKAGKTILLQKVANAISQNNPESKLIVLLIDERPEEVTDMQRSIDGEVVYSTFDKTPENHTKVVELVLERAMRLVELEEDVVILLDSMTRLARAYNLTINPTGRTLSGGLDPGALYGPKRFFGAARNIENGGSLTIISTSLIETGSRMDEVIFEEFKGTGNMEVYLDRKLSEKRIFPAIDINKSGTRREELLLSNKELDAVWTIRKAFSQLDTASVTEAIINLLLKTQNNEHFIASINVSFNDKNLFEAMRGNRPGGQGQGNGNGGKSNGYGGNY